MEELRRRALSLLAAGDAEDAANGGRARGRARPAGRGRAGALPADPGRGRASAGWPRRIWPRARRLFAREGLVPSPALRSAARDPGRRRARGCGPGWSPRSLLRAGTAALDAGAADAGVETLRRAAEEAGRAADPLMQADVLRALGSALVHAVRGSDGEGAVVLHRALAGRPHRRPACGWSQKSCGSWPSWTYRPAGTPPPTGRCSEAAQHAAG